MSAKFPRLSYPQLIPARLDRFVNKMSFLLGLLLVTNFMDNKYRLKT